MSRFEVTTLSDGGLGSLREAIASANANPDADTIVFQAGLAGTITLTAGQLELTQAVVIDGSGAIIIDANHASRVLRVSNNATVTLDGLVLQNGATIGTNGGGIEAIAGTSLTLKRSVVTGNSAGADGGGIFSAGDLSISGSSITSNFAASSNGDGAGVSFGDLGIAGLLTISNSTISDNTAIHYGGGLFFNGEIGGSTLTNVTIARNSAGSGGGVFNFDSELIIRNSTIAANDAATGSGITSFADDGTFTRLGNTVVAANTGAPDVELTADGPNSFLTLGHNFIGNSNGIIDTDSGNGDRAGWGSEPLDPMLGTLANNGGRVQTMKPADNSPLVGMGSNALVLGGNTLDAHGGTRIVGTVDIGAFEIANVAPVASNDSNPSDAVVEANSTNAGDATAAGNVLANDTDFNIGDSKTVFLVRVGPESGSNTFGALGTLAGTYGSLTINANGSFTYTLDNTDPDTNALAAGETAHDIFSYIVRDAANMSDIGEIDIAISGANDAPVIAGGDAVAVFVAENTTAVTTITATDPEAGALTFLLSETSEDGARFSLSDTGVLTLNVAPDFENPNNITQSGIYELEVIVRDSEGLEDTQLMTVTVTNVSGHTIKGHKTNGDRIDGSHGPAGNFTTIEEDTIDGRGGDDTIKAGDGNDTVKGGAGTDRLSGEAGNDLLRGGKGKDVIDGGKGIDTADYSDMKAGVVLALTGKKVATATVGGTADDRVKNVENITGGSKGDTLTGDGKANVLTGNGGHDLLVGGKGFDTLSGGLGNDTLIGGTSNDLLIGGGGADTFVFNVKLSMGNAPTIADFTHKTDHLQLDAKLFAALGATLEKGEFYAKAGAFEAHDLNDRLIYDKTNGVLYFDADGNKAGGKDSILIAAFMWDTKPPKLDIHDFTIV